MKKVFLYTFLVCAVNFISCNSNKEFRGYPNFSSVQYKKSEYSTKISNFQRPTAICSASSATINHMHDVETVSSKGFTVKNNLHLILQESFIQNADNDHLNLTASISNEPFIRIHNSRPDTNLKNNLPSVDSTVKTNISAKPTSFESQENQIKPVKNEREVFAILSLVSALLIVPALILALPLLTFILAIAAIVFGALGLKSKKKNLATIGMILGILAAFLFFIALIFVLSGPIM